MRAGEELGVTPSGLAAVGIALFREYGFDEDMFSIPEELLPEYLKAIGKDKKKKGGIVRFVLMEDQGKPVLTPLSDSDIEKAVTRKA